MSEEVDFQPAGRTFPFGAHLSVVEVVVQMDETDVPRLTLGDSAEGQIDAFPVLDFGRVRFRNMMSLF